MAPRRLPPSKGLHGGGGEGGSGVLSFCSVSSRPKVQRVYLLHPLHHLREGGVSDWVLGLEYRVSLEVHGYV